MPINEVNPRDVSEQEHLEAESKIVTFSYKKPTLLNRPKKHVQLAGTEMMRAAIQVINEGGENELHYHDRVDGMFTVLTGRARFYGPGDKVIGEFGPLEGVFMPKNARYWFESCGEEQLQVLLVQAFHDKAGLTKPGSGRTPLVAGGRSDVG